MSRSLIQTANQSPQTVAVNSNLPLGSVLRKFGCNCRLNGNAVEIEGAGYYTVDGVFTLAPTAAGNVSIAVYKDGVLIPGTTVSGVAAAAEDEVTLPVSTTVRQGCNCDGASQISVVLVAGASSLVSSSLRVEKV